MTRYNAGRVALGVSAAALILLHHFFALSLWWVAVPVAVLCREDCAGLCPVCAADLNEAGPGHGHEAPPDPRWAKLRELELE